MSNPIQTLVERLRREIGELERALAGKKDDLVAAERIKLLLVDESLEDVDVEERRPDVRLAAWHARLDDVMTNDFKPPAAIHKKLCELVHDEDVKYATVYSHLQRGRDEGRYDYEKGRGFRRKVEGQTT